MRKLYCEGDNARLVLAVVNVATITSKKGRCFARNQHCVNDAGVEGKIAAIGDTRPR